MAAIVLDASVAVKWFLADEPDADRALEIRTRVVEGAFAASVPAHFPIEVAAALVRATRRGRFDAVALNTAMRRLRDLPIVAADPGRLEAEAAELAVEAGLHPMDAAYLVLSRRLAAPLITSDRRVLDAGGVTRHEVVWLGDLPAPSAG